LVWQRAAAPAAPAADAAAFSFGGVRAGDNDSCTGEDGAAVFIPPVFVL
jgi:hypothetical protein